MTLEEVGAAGANQLTTISDGDEGDALHTPDEDHVAKLHRWALAINIADDTEIDDETLSRIGQLVTREYQIDLATLSDWRTKTEKAEKIANQIAEEKTYPWPKASNVLYPLITTAAIQFAARAYPAIVAGSNVVKGSVIGSDDGVPMLENGQTALNPQTGGPV
ncbi:MAG: hypothetical protein WDN46_10320 [Methylocella sp.]